ncbi:MAG: phytoene/squalene synthase family protein [Rhizobiaceae bacterium]|nr:phytoene/squalene synthase family protein [Rhizobiaceae bacterium]
MAETSIARGSQSFAAAARLFDPETRRSAMMLYAWCRHCDDVIDEQDLGHRPAGGAKGRWTALTPAARIAALEDQTRRAFAGEPMEDGNFRALQLVVRRHDLPLRLALDHLDGFRMDADGRRYETIEEVLDYCHHVAGVVGVMMAAIMGAKGEDTLRRAADLGLAFQLTNIARDIVADARAGRVYLPTDWMRSVDLDARGIADSVNRAKVASLAARLLAAAEPHYDSARLGIDALPRRSAWAVATALGVYRDIGVRVSALGERAWDERVSTSKADKLGHVVKGAAIAGRRRRVHPARSQTLWTHEL